MSFFSPSKHTAATFVLPLNILQQLSQNAMRATMELYGDAMEYPAVQAQIALGTEDLTVKVNVRRVSAWAAVKVCAAGARAT